MYRPQDYDAMDGARLVDRDDDNLVDTSRMGDYDFVLRMTTRDISDAFVRDTIESADIEDQERLKAVALRSTSSAYRTAKAIIMDLQELQSPEHDGEIDECIAELETYAKEAMTSTQPYRLPDDRLKYFRQLRNDVRRRKKQTGSGLPPDDVSAMDIKPYRVLQLADAIHDFADNSEDGDRREILRKDLSAVLPTMNIPIMPRSKTTVRRKITLADVADKSAFIEAMALNSTLDFGDGPMDNPLHGLDFERNCYVHDSKKDETMFAGYSKRGLFHGVETFCYGTRDTKETILRLQELLYMRDKIDEVFFFSPDSRAFIVDQNALPGHPGHERSPPFIIAWMLGFRNTIASILKYHSVPDKDTSFSSFGKLYFCDASLHDGAKNTVATLSPLGNTGMVFHRDAKVRVTFDGVPTRTSYGLRIESDECPIDIDDPASQRPSIAYDVNVSDGKYATDRETGRDTVFSTSKEAMRLVRAKFGKRNGAVALALKLAGDWGQVEHCKRLGDSVFVTCDKLAAFYAAYRNVPFMYINHHNYLQTGARGDFVHYSFVMMGRRTASPVVAAPPLATSMWGAMRGDGYRRTLANAALFAILLFGALFAKR